MEVTEKVRARKAVTLLVFFLSIPLKTAKNAPLAPKPSKAILMTMNAKWYHMVTENIRVREISISNVDRETRKVPI
jgi:hypothetical protein